MNCSIPLKIDVSATPYSRRGCWLNVAVPRRPSEQPLGPGLYLRSSRARGVSPLREHFKLELLRGGEVVPHREDASVASVVLLPADGSDGRVELFLEGRGTMRVRGEGLGMRCTCTIPNVRVPGGRVSACVTGPGRIDVNFRSCLCRYRFASLRGAIANRTAIRGSEGPGIIIEAGADAAPWELAVDEFGSAWEARDRLPFDQARDEGVVAFESFCGRLAPVPPGWEQARRLAGYIFWSCTKGLSGYFQREPVFMSLNWMDGVWSWDNVFNAVALASGHPELAFDQLMLMADNQDDLGAYPDRVDEFVRHYNYSKPPVHGVLLRELERINPGWWTPARTCTVVDSVARSTQWWLDHRVWPGRSLAHYLHGNDSGWDNTTLLLSGAPLEAPDLNAFLAVQAGWLADKEMQLGRKRRSAHWRSVEERLAREVVAQLWRGRQFIGRKLPGDEEIRSRSLVDCMPVVMGRRLPHDVARAVIRRIRTFMTPVGLATEQPDSPHYKDDGYWRGPVWGASTYLIVLGLESLGEHRLACSLARRFCKTCVRSGFAENFDALTGASRRDPAYTWTAGVFLLLASRCISESRRA